MTGNGFYIPPEFFFGDDLGDGLHPSWSMFFASPTVETADVPQISTDTTGAFDIWLLMCLATYYNYCTRRCYEKTVSFL